MFVWLGARLFFQVGTRFCAVGARFLSRCMFFSSLNAFRNSLMWPMQRHVRIFFAVSGFWPICNVSGVASVSMDTRFRDSAGVRYTTKLQN